MSTVHLMTGYDKITEALAREYPIPSDLLTEIRGIAHVPPSDADPIGSYPLDADAVRRLSLRFDRAINADLFDWFLEPVSDD